MNFKKIESFKCLGPAIVSDTNIDQITQTEYYKEEKSRLVEVESGQQGILCDRRMVIKLKGKFDR